MLNAFIRLDLNAAAQIVRHDEQDDEKFRSIMRQLITFMMEDPRKISTSPEILFVAKTIEHIGDHAKICLNCVIHGHPFTIMEGVTNREIQQRLQWTPFHEKSGGAVFYTAYPGRRSGSSGAAIKLMARRAL